MRASDFQIESQATRDSRLGSVLNSPVAGSWKAYGVWGEASADVGISPASNPVTYGFTGHMVDLESGLNRTEYRQYDPKTGRWLSQEPLGLDGPNQYWYSGNNSLRYTDPNGLWKNPIQVFNNALYNPNSSSEPGTIGNAFQHCYASCVMAAENTSVFSQFVGDVFEVVNWFQGQTSCDMSMDLKNNAAGIDLAAKNKISNLTSTSDQAYSQSKKRCESACMNAAKSGKLTWYKWVTMKIFDRPLAILVLVWGILLNPFLILQLYGFTGDRGTVFWGGTPEYRYIPSLEGFWNAFLEMQVFYLLAFCLFLEIFSKTKMTKLWAVTATIPLALITTAIVSRIVNS